jgi:hypothetical protein
VSTDYLHEAITGHRHWKAFDAEEAATQKLLARAQGHTAKRDEDRRAWEQATEAYEKEAVSAALADREHDPAIPDPGEWVEPRPLLGVRRKPVEVVHQRISELETARKSWAVRMAPELAQELGRVDSAAVARLRQQVDQLNDTVREIGRVRESMAWLRSCGGRAPAPQGLWAVQSLLESLRHAASIVESADAAPAVGEFGAIPFNLDDVDISVS